jgi:hypothetical protein
VARVFRLEGRCLQIQWNAAPVLRTIGAMRINVGNLRIPTEDRRIGD